MIDQRKVIVLHIVFWVLNTLNIVLFWGFDEDIGKLYMIIPFYINYFILVPHLLRRNKPVYYLLWFLAVWSVMIGARAVYYLLIDYYYVNVDLNARTLFSIGAYVSFYYIAISTGSRLWVYWLENKRISHELFLRKINTQLQMVKSNVNIPFILNTLSNIEDQAIVAPENAQKPVIALSNVLRYGLYDSQSEQVALRNEIEILNDYFSLVNQNHSEFSLELQIKGQLDGQVLPPNIIVKFVGNWKSNFENELKGQQVITIENRLKQIVINVPVKNVSDRFLVELEEKFVRPEQKGFTISYSLKNEQLMLVINSL